MGSKSRIALITVASILVVVSVIDVLGILMLRSYGTLRRYAAVADLSNADVYQTTPGSNALANDFVSKDYRALLDQVMNSVSRIAAYNNADAADVYEHVREGGGLQCYGMSTLYYAALNVNGIKARRVSVTRNLLDTYDSHETVEVFLDGKWVIVDPTFHVSFQKDGQLLGATDIRESLKDGSFRRIAPIFYGEVAYPARLEAYYTDWLPLFNNVVLIDSGRMSTVAKLPPFRYWLGPVAYYQSSNSHLLANYAFLNDVYFIFAGLLPGISLACTVIVAGLLIGTIRPERRREE